VFGGPAWTWDGRRGQYYFHNFLPEQPDLNLHNPAVQEAMLDVARFWLDRGIDGFRLDAINFAMHDPDLRDNPPAPPGGKRTRPFDFQEHVYNQSHPKILELLERLRDVADGYGDRFMLAEVGGEHSLAEMRAFTEGGSRLNSAYGFDFLNAERLTPELVAQAAQGWPDMPNTGWPTWTFENHDAPRAISRWAAGAHQKDLARTKMLLLCTLRGSIILYQGEELGLPQVEVPFDQLQDPEAIANWPHTLSRDGARTPMPWSSADPNLGFSAGKPWLPAADSHRALAVDRQEGRDDSLLEFTRKCLALRKAHTALRQGTMRIVEAGEHLLVFDREWDGERLRCTFNLSERTVAFRAAGTELIRAGTIDAGSLEPYAAIVEEIE
jgi:alpha-glucosidase